MTTGVDTTAAFERFLELMPRADRRTATREAVALVESGMPLADFVLEILAPVQAEIGRRWQHAEITPHDERLATDLADTLLSIAAARTDVSEPRARLVLCIAEREHHNLPARMIAELLRAEGSRSSS